MEKEINWASVESGLNVQESDERKNLQEKRANNRDDISEELKSFLDTNKNGESLAVEDFFEEATKEIENAQTPTDAMKSLRFRNLYVAMKAQYKIDAKIEYLQMRKDQIDDILEAQDRDGQESPRLDSATRNITMRIDELENMKDDMVQKSPEAFIGLHLKKLKEYKKQLSEGRLAQTPYFEEQSEELMQSMKKGRPTFIYGHLGSGKTEMAMEVAHDRLVELNTQKDFEQWISENEDATEKDKQKQLHIIRENYKKSNEKEIKEKLSAYFISGSKQIDLSDFYGNKTLILEHLNGKEILEHNTAIENEINKWKDENKDKFSSEDEYRVEYQLASERIADIYKEKNFATGTAVKEVLNQVALAAKEGRPVIIDEVNAIPHETLISLNHILTRRTGDIGVRLPGVEEDIDIKEGFCIIFTGNLNDGVNEKYLMRQDLDPALMNRLDKLPHDYLPQDTEGAMEANANSEDSQLFHLILAMEIGQKGDLNLPEGDMEKLWHLAQFARRTQDIFSGKEQGKFYEQGSGKGTDIELEQSVCSVRNIIRVLEEYNKGRDGKSIDQVLWEKFIKQATVPADQVLLYQLAHSIGFFPESEGWEMLNFNAVSELRALDQKDVHSDNFNKMHLEPEFLSSRDVVELAYGKAPERTVFPEMTSTSESEEINIEDIVMNDEQFEDIESFVGVIDEMIDKFAQCEGDACKNE